MSDKIPTIEQYLDDYYPEEDGNKMLSREQARRVMKGFAGIHVKAALEAASEKAYDMNAEIDKNAILNSYPLDLIK